jgi:hypothetical protein
LIVAHGVWAFAYTTGTVIRRPRLPQNAGEALLSIVIATATGLALLGLFTFGLGCLGLIRHIGFAIYVLIVAVAFVLAGDSPLSWQFWQVRWQTWRRAFASPAVVIYVLALIDAAPAALPDHLFDSLFFYNVLAHDYAQFHHIVIDMWLRNPFYTNNWVLLETWFFTFHREADIPFLTWLTGMLSLLAVYGAVVLAAARTGLLERSRLVTIVIAVASAAALLFNPMFLWMNSGGMLDVQLGFLFLIPALCAWLAFTENDASYVWPMIIVAGFLAGAKISYIGLIPVFALASAVILRSFGESWKRIAVALVVLVALSSPWYVANIIGDGDPVPPIVNIALGHPDLKWSPADAASAAQNLGHRRGALGLLSFPIELFENAEPAEFVSDGVTAVVLILMVPAMVFAFGMLWRGAPRNLTIYSGVLTYVIAFWLLTSPHARFMLLFYAALCAFAGMLLIHVVNRRPSWAVVAGIAAVLLAVPTPSSAQWLQGFIAANLTDPPASYTSRAGYLAPRISGYVESLYLSNELGRLGRKDKNVYSLSLETAKYAFTRHGLTLIGDWFGRDAYDRFVAGLKDGSLKTLLTNLDIDAVLLPVGAKAFTPAETAEFAKQLMALGFTERLCGNDGIRIFIADDAAAPACDPVALVAAGD